MLSNYLILSSGNSESFIDLNVEVFYLRELVFYFTIEFDSFCNTPFDSDSLFKFFEMLEFFFIAC